MAEYNNENNNDRTLLDDAADAAKNKIGGKVRDEISDQIVKKIAEEAAKQAATQAATTGAAGAVGGAAGGMAVNAGSAAAGAAGSAAAGAGGAAGGAAAGAAVGTAIPVPVIGTLVGLALGLITAGAKAIDSVKTEDGQTHSMTFFILLFFMTMVISCSTLLSHGIASVLSSGQQAEYTEKNKESKKVGLAERHADNNKQFKKNTDKLEEYSHDFPLKNTINRYIYGDGGGEDGANGLREALHKGIYERCKILIEDGLLKSVKRNNGAVDEHRTWECFFENKWPYDARISAEGSTYRPKVGNIMSGLANEKGCSYETDTAKYDDVNWAELMVIMSQNETPNGHQYALKWGECNYKDFMEFVQTERVQNRMFECAVKWIPVYRGEKDDGEDEDGNPKKVPVVVDGPEYDSPEGIETAPETIWAEGVECTYSEYWCKTTLKPFGLREVYDLSSVEPLDFNDRFYNHKNWDLLNYQERVTRIYQRDTKRTIITKTRKKLTPFGGYIEKTERTTVNSLGVVWDKDRDKKSPIYNDLFYDKNKGAWNLQKDKVEIEDVKTPAK